jgi:uncharacterized protein (DUF433 family)
MCAKDSGRASVSHSPMPDATFPPSRVEKTSDVCGGEARIRRTRVTVWGLVEWRNLGLSDAEILEHLPDLTPADLQAAWEYYGRHTVTPNI